MEACGETTLMVENSQNVFQWKEFGLKVSINHDSLPPDIKQCSVHITVSLSGQYSFPNNTHCVSAIFWFRCEPACRFKKAITIEIEHCAKSVNMLSFARAVCTQKDLPYSFELLQGDFSSHSCYGLLQVNRFSGITIVNQGSDEREYSAHLFYLFPEVHLLSLIHI